MDCISSFLAETKVILKDLSFYLFSKKSKKQNDRLKFRKFDRDPQKAHLGLRCEIIFQKRGKSVHYWLRYGVNKKFANCNWRPSWISTMSIAALKTTGPNRVHTQTCF